MRKFRVSEPAQLQNFLFEALKDTKKTRVKQFLKYGSISVNGETLTQYNYPLRPGDEVWIQTSPADRPQEPELGVRIIYEDDFLIACDKPSGVLTIATESIKRKDALYAVNAYVNGGGKGKGGEAASFEKKIFVVHRLDRDASGVLLFAKNFEIKNKLQKNWEQFHKYYYTVVEGDLANDYGEIRSYLRQEKTLRVFSGPERPGSKLAITRYQVVRRSDHYTHLEIELITGRKHQIRVHLADLGHPIAGDKDYGSQSNPSGRLALHAFRLEIDHPVSAKRLTFESPIPKIFLKIDQ